MQASFTSGYGGSWPVDFEPSHPKKGDFAERSVGTSFEHSGVKIISLPLCTETLLGILRLRNPIGIVRRIGMIYRRGNLYLAVGARLPWLFLVRAINECIVTAKKSCKAWLGEAIARLRLLERLNRSGILHHFLVALSLTSMVFLAKQAGMMTFLDALTINLSQRLLAERNDKDASKEASGGILSEPCKDSSDPRCNAALLVITADDYLHSFNNTSPLDRDELAVGLGRLFESKPAVVLIDLDLAPSTSQYQKDDRLDGILKEAIELHGIKLVIITPILNNVDSRADEWLRQQCQQGVGLAFPSVRTTFGIVLDYSELYPSLGVVARSFIPRRANSGRSGKPFNVCAEINLRDQLLEQQNPTWLGGKEKYGDLFKHAYRESSAYIDWRKTQDVNRTNWKTLLHDNMERLENSFQNRVVFVGSEYGSHDRFQSPVGIKRGVETHMAIAYSDLSEEHIFPYSAEIVVGTIVGTIGAWSWKWHRKLRKDHLTGTAHGRINLWGHAWRFAGRGVLVILPAVIVLFTIVLFMHLSVGELAKGNWINPAPLMVGMLLDILMLRDDAHEEVQRRASESGKWIGWVVHHPAWLIHGPLIIGALWILIGESRH